MQLPIIMPAPLVQRHAVVFRDLFSNRRQFRHFENYLTGLTVLPNKSMANMSRCIVDSADKTNLARFFSAADRVDEEVNERRLHYILAQTESLRQGGVAGTDPGETDLGPPALAGQMQCPENSFLKGGDACMFVSDGP